MLASYLKKNFWVNPSRFVYTFWRDYRSKGASLIFVTGDADGWRTLREQIMRNDWIPSLKLNKYIYTEFFLKPLLNILSFFVNFSREKKIIQLERETWNPIWEGVGFN